MHLSEEVQQVSPPELKESFVASTSTGGAPVSRGESKLRFCKCSLCQLDISRRLDALDRACTLSRERRARLQAKSRHLSAFMRATVNSIGTGSHTKGMHCAIEGLSGIPSRDATRKPPAQQYSMYWPSQIVAASQESPERPSETTTSNAYREWYQSRQSQCVTCDVDDMLIYDSRRPKKKREHNR